MKTEIIIPVSELKAVLPGLSRIVPRSSTLPVLGCIKVSGTEGNGVTLQAHNLDEIATVRLENSAAAVPGELLVPAGMLGSLIKGCPGDCRVHLIADGESTRIRYPVAGNMVERQLPHTPAAEWPQAKQVTGEPITLDVSFKQALKEALESASTDSARYVLNGACLDVRDKAAHYVIGTDGRHLYSANSFQFNLPESLIVPGRKFVVWPAFLNDGPWKLRMLPGIHPEAGDIRAKQEAPWLEITSDRWTYIAKAIDGQYPNWKQVLPGNTDGWTQVVLSPEALQAMQTAIPVLPGNELECRTVVLEATSSALNLRARGRDDKEDTVVPITQVRVTGKPTHAALNRSYLLKALKCGLNTLRIDDPLTPILFSNPGKTMIIMPVRLDHPLPPPAAAESQPTEAPSAVPQTNSLPASPSAEQDRTTTESAERKDMSNETMAPPARGNLKAHANGEESSTIRDLIENVEEIKGNLRQVITDLNETVSMLKAVEKENKATSKEIASVRQTLRSLQSVEI